MTGMEAVAMDFLEMGCGRRVNKVGKDVKLRYGIDRALTPFLLHTSHKNVEP